ncbi:MAG: type II toxin-antitoxin system HicA family toxin [bacterium]
MGYYFIRQKGSQQIYKHPKAIALLNLLNYKGEIKPYQVRQFMDLIKKYGLKSVAKE